MKTCTARQARSTHTPRPASSWSRRPSGVAPFGPALTSPGYAAPLPELRDIGPYVNHEGEEDKRQANPLPGERKVKDKRQHGADGEAVNRGDALAVPHVVPGSPRPRSLMYCGTSASGTFNSHSPEAVR